MKACIEVAVYHGQNSEGIERKFWRHYIVMESFGHEGCGDIFYTLDDLEWELKKFEQRCLDRGIKDIAVINFTSLNILGFLCGEILEGKELSEEKITGEDEE